MNYTSKEAYNFMSDQTNDPIVEWKTCTVSGTEFPIYQSDIDFLTKISPVFAGKKYPIPLPTICPEERQRRRLAWRNERNFFTSTCEMSGESVIANHNPKDYSIYSNTIWWGDTWDPLDYGRDIDIQSSFFDQYKALEKNIPHVALINDDKRGSENSQYAYDCLKSNNCYMSQACIEADNVYYCKEASKSKDVAECTIVYQSQLCIECTDSRNITRCMYLHNCSDCSHCIVCRECIQCHDCIGCFGLQNQKYCINNKQYSKEEYIEHKELFMKKLYTDADQCLNKTYEFINQATRVATMTNQCENCYGNNLFSSKNLHFCFDMKESKDCRYFFLSAGAKNSMDITISCWGERCYESMVCDGSWKSGFTLFCNDCKYTWYSQYCSNCQNCFGCHGLRRKKYCIFNKQYTKSEYEELVPKIIEHMQDIGEWGEFFPIANSPFGYDLSDAMSWMPLSEDACKKLNYKRDNIEIRVNIPEQGNVVKLESISANPFHHNDELTKKIVVCSISGRPYRFLSSELKLYQKLGAPLSHIHPDERNKARMKRRAPREMHLRNCNNCNEKTLSVYPENTEFEVYCKKCYNKEIYG